MSADHGTVREDAPERARIDPWVFFIAAGISLRLRALGRAGHRKPWHRRRSTCWLIISTFGWLFVLSTVAFLVFAAVLAFSRFGRAPARRGRRPARVPHVVVDRDDVQRRHGHRPHVLRRRGAHLALAAPPLGNGGRARRRPRSRRCITYFHWALTPGRSTAIVGLALGYFCFRKGRPTSSAPRSTPCSATASTGPSAGRSTSSRSSPPCSAAPHRSASARCRSTAA